MDAGAVSNGGSPGGGSAFQFAEQRAAEIEVSLAALQFEKKIVGLTISAAILFVDGFLQMDQNFGSSGIARGELVASFQVAEFFFELEQTQFLVACVENRQEGV